MDGAGTAHTIWLDHRGMAAPAGAAAGAKHAGHGATDAAYDGVAMAQKSGLYYASAGAAPASERELAKGVCYCCKTAMTVTPDGAIHAAWRHVYAGNLRDIAATVSRDGGRTFSEPVRISEDGWEIAGCPDDGPAMAADGTGTVHVIWPTMLDGPTPEGALFYSFTRDGVTFAPRTRIPTLGQSRPTHPQIAVDQQGRVMVAWDEFTSGMRMAAAREVKRPGTATIDLGPVVIIEPRDPRPIPRWRVRLRGFLVSGQLAATPRRSQRERFPGNSTSRSTLRRAGRPQPHQVPLGIGFAAARRNSVAAVRPSSWFTTTTMRSPLRILAAGFLPGFGVDRVDLDFRGVHGHHGAPSPPANGRRVWTPRWRHALTELS
jgi:hypothetical protein